MFYAEINNIEKKVWFIINLLTLQKSHIKFSVYSLCIRSMCTDSWLKQNLLVVISRRGCFTLGETPTKAHEHCVELTLVGEMKPRFEKASLLSLSLKKSRNDKDKEMIPVALTDRKWHVTLIFKKLKWLAEQSYHYSWFDNKTFRYIKRFFFISKVFWPFQRHII